MSIRKPYYNIINGTKKHLQSPHGRLRRVQKPLLQVPQIHELLLDVRLLRPRDVLRQGLREDQLPRTIELP